MNHTHKQPASSSETRTHIVLPTTIVAKIDARFGPRRRGKFLTTLAEQELARLELVEAAEAAAGSLSTGEVPEWDTHESTVEWVRNLRQQSNERLEQVFAKRE